MRHPQCDGALHTGINRIIDTHQVTKDLINRSPDIRSREVKGDVTPLTLSGWHQSA
ncbi:hypothetical protein AA0242T_0093 [Acetobacter aceti NRIC 0242]|nr:hypothetical protein AA0242T_0093 [Acetobacter aceti NRIC 0242]